MEIDFLGLNSTKYKLEQGNIENSFTDTGGGVEISLSLSTSSSLNFSDLQKKKWEFSGSDEMISSSCSGSTICGLEMAAPPAFRRPAVAGFLYDLNDAATPNSRNMAESNVYIITGNASTAISTGGGGHTPTVAMARRATLARFLEKRLHRMNQARASHLMGKSLGATSSEACESPLTRNNKKKSNDLKRR